MRGFVRYVVVFCLMVGIGAASAQDTPTLKDKIAATIEKLEGDKASPADIATAVLKLLIPQPPAPPKPPENAMWIVMKAGKVVKAPDVSKLVESGVLGIFNLTAFPDEGEPKAYTVTIVSADAPPPPPPGPTPTGLAAKVQEWATAAGISKADLVVIADNYITVGSQGSDPARSSGWDLQAFTSATKALNLSNIGVDKIAMWNTKFFQPLAVWQSDTFKQRGLTVNDREKIAALWTETGNGIKDAAK